jgi:hypothetical protein
MEPSSCSEFNCSSTIQCARRHLWNPKVHYRVHNSPPVSPVFRQMDQFISFHFMSLRYSEFISSMTLSFLFGTVICGC